MMTSWIEYVDATQKRRLSLRAVSITPPKSKCHAVLRKPCGAATALKEYHYCPSLAALAFANFNACVRMSLL